MDKSLISEIELNHDKAAIIPIERLDDLEQEMEDLENGSYHTGYINWAAKRRNSFKPTGINFEARSIIVVASPSPVCIVNFMYNGKKYKTMLPPTYCDSELKEAKITRYINDFLKAGGFHAELTDNLPSKLLAVHCGLGKYGRNNICYVHGFGSYANLYTFYSDIPSKNNYWFLVQRMDDCDTCRKCVDVCPTKAIDVSRKIINAEICLTSMNEQGGEFPEWLDNKCHTCLVGCMRCQACCPQNAENSKFITNGCEFTEYETRCILEDKAGGEYPDGIVIKLKSIGIFTFRKVLTRNLAALIGLQ